MNPNIARILISNKNLIRKYMAVSSSASPYITIYKRSGGVLSKLPDPGTLPTGAGAGIAASNSGRYVAIAHSASPYVTIYKRSGDTFTKLTNPLTLPGVTGEGISWSPSDTYLVVGSNSSPLITIYKRNGDTFTKLANPATPPNGYGYSIAWAPDESYFFVASDNISSNSMCVYYRSGDTFTFSAVADPPGIGGFGDPSRCVAISPDGAYIAVGFTHAPYFAIYVTALGTWSGAFVSKPNTSVNAVCWSPDNVYLTVGYVGTPYIINYKNNMDHSFTRLTTPAVIPTSAVSGISYSRDGQYLAAISADVNKIYMYLHNGDTLTNIAAPLTLPVGTGNNVCFFGGPT